MKYKYSVLLAVVIVGLALRLFGIGSVPASPDWDEVALGYNAYSILQTGRDEYGQWFPIIFRSFDDYKPGLYVYLTVPFIALGGLSVEMVRLPSVLIGTVSIVAVYFLVVELLSLGMAVRGLQKTNRVTIALASAFLMAVSPWHIQFSRVAFESSVGMAFTIFGTLFFLKGLKRSSYWYATAIFFAFAVYVYQSEKVFVPLLSIALAAIFWKELIHRYRMLIGPGIVFMLIAAPFYYQTIATPDALLRARGVSLFADQTPYLERSVSRLIHDNKTGNIVGKIVDNRRVEYAKGFVAGYISHFDINWLFLTGDEERHNPPNFGHMYLFELPFLLIGVYLLLTGSFSRKSTLLLVTWILLAPIPASITSGTPHPIRTIHFLPGIHIVSGIGIYRTFGYIRSSRWPIVAKNLVLAGLGIAAVLNIAFYLDQYFIQYNYESSQSWQYGYAQAVAYAESVKEEFSAIVVSSEQPLDQSYMFFLFYTGYDPRAYLAEGGTYSGGFAQENSFGPYVFRPIDWEREQSSDDVLYIGRPVDIKSGRVTSFAYLDGQPALVVGIK